MLNEGSMTRDELEEEIAWNHLRSTFEEKLLAHDTALRRLAVKTFILGLLIGLAFSAIPLFAQSTGIFTDERGRMYQYGTMPGGAVNLFGPNGERGTFFQQQGVKPHNPC
jgi:hypothetical protein